MPSFTKLFYFLFMFILISCGGDSSNNNGTNTPAPSPGPTVVNFVIASQDDDVSGVTDAGSVMLISGKTGVQIGSTISGDDANDNLGRSSVTSLGNGNFVIVSNNDDVGGVSNAGSVILVNGVTGTQIGSTIAGDDANQFNSTSSITSLDNGNFVIATRNDDVGGISDAGSVMLINGSTGAQIGTTISGDNTSDFLGSRITLLDNGNFVITSHFDDVGGVVDAGSVMLIDGSTGAQIGATISGDDTNDFLGFSSVISLGNGNFVVASQLDVVGGVINVGSVILVNGFTGTQIGSTITGDSIDDQLGVSGITSLGNGNFVIASQRDDVGGVSNAGSVMLINGSTGVQIGSTISGDNTDDFLGSSGVTSLGNENFAIASALDDVGGVSNAGSVILVSGSTGVQIGSTTSGDNTDDFLGNSSVTSLGNGNFVIASERDDVGGVLDAGSVMIINGVTGVQIGSTISGDNTNDFLGGSSITSLGNGNFVIASRNDDMGGITDAGSVILVSGSTGTQIGATISGDAAIDRLGESSVTSLGNGNFVIASQRDDSGGVNNTGSVMLINGFTGAQIGATIFGDDTNDFLGESSVTSLGNGNFVIASQSDDFGGVTDAGSVMVINGSTADQIGTTISGDDAGDGLGSSSVTLLE